MNNVVNDLVGYDNLKIIQNKDYFNFSLESVLLPNFCSVNNKMKILDLCTGNAPIPVILSTKTNSKIIGVELQKEIYDLAVKTVSLNNLQEQIEIINDDAIHFAEITETDSFDLITCNPPYFKYLDSSLLNDNSIKAIARHEIKIKLQDIIRISRKLLKNNGSLVLVHQTERFSEIIELLTRNNLEPKKVCFVYPKENTNSNLVLIEAKKNGKKGLTVLKPLICHKENGEYTEEIMEMFRRN